MSTTQQKLTDLQHRRIQGGRLIERGYRNGEIVKILNCGLTAVKEWRKIVRKKGSGALAPPKRIGRTPKINGKQLAKLKRLLKKGATEFGYANAIWTSRRVRQLIEDQFGINYSTRQVRRILRGLGYSPKKPVKRSEEYSAQKVEHWRHYIWPHIKKVS